jgi:hypothetical protein
VRTPNLTAACLALTSCGLFSPTPDAPPVDPRAPVTLPTSGEPAPWRVPGERVIPSERGLGSAEQLAVGLDVALWRTTRGVFALSATRGVLGRLALPEEAAWVGLGAGDSVLAASRAGALWRAPDPTSALREGAFAQVGRAPGAGGWDASPTHVVAMTPTELFVSRDDGATFTTVTVVEGAWVRYALARPDGLLVAIVENAQGRRLHFSRDDGATWEPSGFHPQRIRRDGAWIWNADLTCPAIMGADPMTWSADPDVSRLPGWKDPRRHMLRLSDAVVAPRDGLYASATRPPAPTVDPKKAHVGLTTTCLDPIPDADSITPTRSSADDAADRDPLPPPCVGAQCLREAGGAGAPPSAELVSLLADAACATPACQAVTRPPHMLVQRPGEGVLDTVALPAGCAPARLFDAGGLAVLTCREGDGVALYTRPSGGAWVKEASVASAAAADLVSHSALDDGTLVLHGRCAPDLVSPCAPSLLRAPRPAGGADAWTPIDLPGLTLARPLPGGEAIAVTSSSASTEEATVWRVGEGGAQELVAITGIDGALRDVRVSADGALTARVGDTFTPATFTVTRAGALVARPTKRPSSSTPPTP